MSGINSDFDLTSLGLSLDRRVEEQRDQGELGQEEFLKLMTAQFRNQDPFKPMESGEFLGQLASFGTVSGIGDLKESVNELATAMLSEQALQASSLVGRNVLARSITGALPEIGPLAGAVELPAESTQVSVQIRDASGSLVRELELGPQQTGLAHFEWDGYGLNGVRAAPGIYYVEAQALVAGSMQALETYASARVASVDLTRSGQGLTLSLEGLGELTLDQVRQITAN